MLKSGVFLNVLEEIKAILKADPEFSNDDSKFNVAVTLLGESSAHSKMLQKLVTTKDTQIDELMERCERLEKITEENGMSGGSLVHQPSVEAEILKTINDNSSDDDDNIFVTNASKFNVAIHMLSQEMILTDKLRENLMKLETEKEDIKKNYTERIEEMENMVHASKENVLSEQRCRVQALTELGQLQKEFDELQQENKVLNKRNKQLRQQNVYILSEKHDELVKANKRKREEAEESKKKLKCILLDD